MCDHLEKIKTMLNVTRDIKLSEEETRAWKSRMRDFHRTTNEQKVEHGRVRSEAPPRSCSRREEKVT